LLRLWKVVEQLGLSYKTANKLNQIINQELPGHPLFKSQDLVIGGKCIQFHYHDVIPCIQALFGDPEFAGKLAFAPEQHYTDRKKTC
jgi:Plavaka transposase